MFNHLHVHTEFSLLDGMSKVEELFRRAKELGQEAIAITDHGTCSALFEAVKFAPKYGVKAILGCEFYLDLSEYGDKKTSHVILLAKNNKGLENIFKLHEYSYVHGHKAKPCVTIDALRKHSNDVVCMTACLANIIPRSIMKGELDVAEQFIQMFKEIYGKNLFLEVQSNVLSEQYTANKGLEKFAEKYNVELVATNDVHYTYKSDADIHDVLLAMQTKRKMNDPKRWSFPSQCYWLKSEEEFIADLQGLTEHGLQRAVKNTVLIADMCNATIERGNYLPKYHTIPEGDTEEKMLRRLVTEKYKQEIFDKGIHTPDYFNAVKHELDVIERNGYSGYHLIVQDFVNHARNNNIPVGDGRGSGAGCKVAYITGITRVEPNQYNLLFERFLADGREPDYDWIIVALLGN